jgi:hypothetical protein
MLENLTGKIVLCAGDFQDAVSVSMIYIFFLIAFSYDL